MFTHVRSSMYLSNNKRTIPFLIPPIFCANIISLLIPFQSQILNIDVKHAMPLVRHAVLTQNLFILMDVENMCVTALAMDPMSAQRRR